MSTASRGSQGGSGISFQTLAIASLSSLAAALVVHKVWGGGAIVGAAVTPVIVGIVGEALRHPVDKLAAPRDGGRRLPADRAHDVPPASRERGDDPFGLWEQDRRRSSRGRTWLVLGLVTGVIGFAIAAFFLTGSELVFGGSVAGPSEDDDLRRRAHHDDRADRDPDDDDPQHDDDADGHPDRSRSRTPVDHHATGDDRAADAAGPAADGPHHARPAAGDDPGALTYS